MPEAKWRNAHNRKAVLLQSETLARDFRDFGGGQPSTASTTSTTSTCASSSDPQCSSRRTVAVHCNRIPSPAAAHDTRMYLHSVGTAVTTLPLPPCSSADWAPLTPQHSPHDVSDVAAAVDLRIHSTMNRNSSRVKMEHMETTIPSSDASASSSSSETKPHDTRDEAHDDDARSALELKRLRNRECMRRSRNRKMGEIASMKSEIAQLEQHLRKRQVERAAALAAAPCDITATSSATPVERVVDALQRENFALRDAIREKDKLRELVAPLLEQEKQRIALDAQQRAHEEQHTDQFAWLRHVVPLLKLKTMSRTDVAALVRTSCDEIVASAQHADTAIQSPNLVLGWSDKRIVDDACVRFVFGKDFVHQSIDEITTKSWVASSDLSKVKAFQPRTQNMVCLQRWDDNTVVVARNLPVPQRCGDGLELDRNYCSVILLFRLQTPTGFVVGSRTLAAKTVQTALLRAGEFCATYVDVCYGLLFTPLCVGSPVGCNVRFGGRSGNGTPSYAKVCAMDVLLATLQWENYCIAPLNRLGL